MECLAWLKAVGALHLAKVCSMIVVTIIVLVFNGRRPKVPDIYHTNDPFDTQRNGISYVCGCSLPTSLETPQNPTEPLNSSWNVCYGRSSLKTTKVLVYPNFSGVENLEDNLRDAYGLGSPLSPLVDLRTTEVDGCLLEKQAHALDWGDNQASFEKYTDLLSKDQEFILNPYLGGYTQSELFADVKDLEKLSDFPAPYVAMTFAFRCSNCSSCNLDSVTRIFQHISQLSGTGQWGECSYWGDADECSLKNQYQAKCTMYPSAPIPLAFGIQGFFQNFNKLQDINDIRPLRYPDHVNRTSFVPNEFFMYLKRLVPGKIKFSFLETQERSSAWTSLLNSYPFADFDCSYVSNRSQVFLPASNTSICNLYNSKATGYKAGCVDMRFQDSCREMHANTTINDVPTSTWNDFNVQPGDWQSLMCPPYNADFSPSCLVVQQTAPAVQGRVLNEFLDSTTATGTTDTSLQDVCTQTYTDIVTYPWRDENNYENITLFMETKCSESTQFSDGYCWLTGNYHKLTDIPGTPWHNMTDNSTAKDRFVCYKVANQGVVTWFIFLVGILFGWLGTIDLAFTWIARFCCKPTTGAEQSFDSAAVADAPNEEGNTRKDARSTNADLEEVSATMVATQGNLESDFRSNMGLEMDVASEPNLQSAGGGTSGPIAELARIFSRNRTYSKTRVN